MNRKLALFSLFAILFLFCLPNVFSSITITNVNPENNSFYPKHTSQVNATCSIYWSSGYCSTGVLITKRFIDPLTGYWVYTYQNYNYICGPYTIYQTMNIPSPPSDLSGNTVYWGCDVNETLAHIYWTGPIWQFFVLDTAPPYVSQRYIDGTTQSNYVVPTGATQVNLSSKVVADSGTVTTVIYLDGNQYCYSLIANNTRKDCLINLAGLTGTTHEWIVGMKDTYGWYNSSTWYFYTASGNAIPVINSVNLSPGLNVQIGQNLIVSTNATDPEGDAISYNLFCDYPSSEQGWNNNSMRTCYGWSTPGYHKVRIYAGDLSIHGADPNTYNYREYNVLVGNANVPQVTLNSPLDNQQFSTNGVDFYWTVSADNSNTVNNYLFVDGIAKCVHYNIAEGVDSCHVSNLNYGNHEWYVASEDTLGLFGYSSIWHFFVATNNSCPYILDVTPSSLNIGKNETVSFVINASDPESNFISTDITCNYPTNFPPYTWIMNGWNRNCIYQNEGTYTVRIDVTDTVHGYNLSAYNGCPTVYRVITVGNYTTYPGLIDIPTDPVVFLEQVFKGVKGFFARILIPFIGLLILIVLFIFIYSIYKWVRINT